MSYYKIINGLRYDRVLLEEAQRMTKGQGDGRISHDDIRELYERAMDAGAVTDIEKRTLLYIRDHFNATDKAVEWLNEQDLPALGPEKTIEKVVRREFGLKNLQLEFNEEEVARQQELPGDYSFEEILGNALNMLATPADYRGFISPWDFFEPSLAAKEHAREPFRIGLANMDEGVLYLLPLDFKEKKAVGEFSRELPGDDRSPEEYWIFGLEIPRYPRFRFFAFLKRKGRYGSYAKAFLSHQFPLDERLRLVVEGYLDAPGLQWKISPEEVARQEEFGNAVSFEDVLYWVLSLGLTNGESSVSLYDYFIQEVWIDEDNPDASFDFFLREYLRHGVLYLLPTDYEESVKAGRLDFPFSPYYSGDYDEFWYFGLKFPGKTDVHYQLIMSREDDEPHMEAWSDGFIDGERPLAELIPHVIREDFQLHELEWDIPIEELLDQQGLDPSWRSFNGVLRQTLNTFLYDDSTEDSLFRLTVQSSAELGKPRQNDGMNWGDAVRQKIRNQLNGGKLQLMPARIYDMDQQERDELLPPADGADIQENYVFQLRLPTFPDHYFFAVIPRKVSEENVPYNYGYKRDESA